MTDRNVTTEEIADLIRGLDNNQSVTFSFGFNPRHVSLQGDTQTLETIRDEKELDAVREFQENM